MAFEESKTSSIQRTLSWALLSVFLGTTGCGGYMSALQDARTSVDEARFEAAEKRLHELEASVSRFNPRERFTYFYLRAYIAQQLNQEDAFADSLYLANAALHEAEGVDSAERRWVQKQITLRKLE